MLPFYAAFLVFGCAVNTIGPMLPALAAHVQLQPTDMAPLLSAKGAGGLIGSFLCPLLPLVRLPCFPTERQLTRSQSLLLPGGLLCISASFAAIPAASNLLQLAVVYSFAAAVYQAVSIAAHTLIAQEHGESAGPHLNGINALFGAGSLLAPAVHRTLSAPLAHLSPLASYWVISVAALAAALPFLSALLPSGPAPGQAAKPAAHAGAGVRRAWSARQLTIIALAMALVACNVGAENCFGTWLYTYASERLGAAPAGNAVSLFWGSFTLGRLLAIPASARLSPAALLLGSLPLAVAGPMVVLLGGGARGCLFAGAIAGGLGLSTGFANSVSLLARHVPPSGAVQAAVQVAATAGSMIFPPAVALIAQRGVFGVRGRSSAPEGTLPWARISDLCASRLSLSCT